MGRITNTPGGTKPHLGTCVLETAPSFSTCLLQALLPHLDQNLQDSFHHFEISWADFQLEGVLDKVPKMQYLIKLSFLFPSLPWDREEHSEQSQLHFVPEDFVPPGKQRQKCPQRKSIAFHKGVYQNLMQSRWQHSRTRVRQGISKEIFAPWALL